MADRELVIKIPEEEYEIIKTCTAPMTWIEHLIKNGTPLPKGHGRLIDADYMSKQLLSLPKDEFSTEDMWAMKVLDLAPTIIEADKESEIKDGLSSSTL